nr:DUF72 domain-containing protein [Chryseobacterium sp. P1-3]
MKKENLYIGCSGFYNNDWKGSLYPENAQSKDFLSLYSQTFNAVEINSTFYRIPTAKTLLKWYDGTPDTFRFFIKIPKDITHQKTSYKFKRRDYEILPAHSRPSQPQIIGLLIPIASFF